MVEQGDFGNDPASIIEEIEQQLEDILKKRKGDIERDLEERITREKEEARRKMEQVDHELSEDKEALGSYRDILTELDTEKTQIKKNIQEHLDKAAALQTEIEAKTGQTLEELNSVRELSTQLEELAKKAESRVQKLRQGFEEKYGIAPEIPELLESEEVMARIEQELLKLNRIKELLESDDLPPSEPETVEPPADSEPEKEPSKEAEEEANREEAGETAESETSPEIPEDATTEPEKVEEPEPIQDVQEETEIINFESGILSETADASESPLPEEEAPVVEADETSLEPGPAESPEDTGDEDVPELLVTLRKYRKSEGTESDGEVAYFENEENITLDAEYVIASIVNRVEQAKKLYIQLSHTESPKEQFFIKQEIIQHQETLRKLMLSTIRMSEKDPAFLPKYTEDVLNIEILKTVLEKVSMENWSNQEDFTSFDEFARHLREEFYRKITPPEEYLQSIVEALKIVV